MKATEEIKEGDPIITQKESTYIPAGKYLLGRFDGSCKWRKGTPQCGAGIVIYIASDSHILTEILPIVAPLPNAKDSMEAEAVGAAKTCNEIFNLLRQSEFKGLEPLIQGDNKPVIGYSSSNTRLRSSIMFDTLHPAAMAAYNANTLIQWQHIPRDHNPVADKIAKEGADAVADGTCASRCDINGNIIRLGIGDYHSPFDCNLTKKQKEAATDYLKGVNTGVRAHRSLFLP